MLFYFFCFIMYGKIRNRLKGVYIKKRPLDVYTGYLFVSCVAIFTEFILNLLAHRFPHVLFLGFALCYVCTDFL